MKTERVISVVMPVYNASLYLKEAIESILTQTFSNFEFIIIDDGSTDNSAEIIESYNDERIKFYKNEQNKGLIFTLNKSIQLAKSAIIARMDADDVSLPNRLNIEYNYLTNNPECALVCSWIKLINNDGHEICIQDRYNKHMYYDLLFKCVIAHPTVMFKKDIALKYNLYTRDHAEDFDLWSKIVNHYKIHKIDQALLNYRLSNTSISNITLRKEYQEETKEIVQANIKSLVNKKKIDDVIIECYMDNFEPILKLNKLSIYRSALSILNEINKKFLAKENPNRNLKNIREAAFNKKLLILNKIRSKLTGFNGIYLLIITNSWDLLYYFTKQKIKTVLR
jgi:glycosyltransferase involved in cell wall biosynthesis